MKYQLINSIDGTPILMSGKPVFYDNKKDATTGAIGAAFWFGVPVSVRKVQTRKNGRLHNPRPGKKGQNELL